MTNPETVLRSFGLSDRNLGTSRSGLVNDVYVGERFAVRINKPASNTDHAHEASLALHALGCGVRTARPVAWDSRASVWERVAGTHPDVDSTPDHVWQALLSDLERLHANPPSPAPQHTPTLWQANAQTIKMVQALHVFMPEIQMRVLAALRSKHATPPPTFVHGDAHAGNVLVDGGHYVALVDWGCAAWQSLEAEASRLEDPALEMAQTRWSLNLALVYTMRLGLLVQVLYHVAQTMGKARTQDLAAVLAVLEKLEALP